jgi:coenzyme F420-reducing hydrogenase alpha subunit
MSSRTLKVDILARVEGEGAMTIKIKEDKVEDVKLRIFEPPRFFEAFLVGRHYAEAPDITARICGICPVAYQMSSVHAMEQALGIQVEGQLRELRRLIYCGEWIESHTLHMYMLHAPDFLGYPDVVQMVKDHKGVVENALKLKKAGNAIVSLIGGREIHPVNVRVGGFYKTPTREALQALVEPLKWSLDTAFNSLKLLSTFEFPSLEQDYEFVALRHFSEYPFCEGHIVSNRGVDIHIDQFEEHFVEEHVEHSNALHGHHKGFGNYHVGPLARYNLNHGVLSPLAKQAAQEARLGDKVSNPFKSLLVRGVETVYAIDEALRIIEQYKRPDKPHIEGQPRAGKGCGCSEAPRGICFHSYDIDDGGIITKANIVPPTSQNQPTIESDLLAVVSKNLDLDDDELTWRCEQAIRNYDPCISCATHFLKVNIERK